MINFSSHKMLPKIKCDKISDDEYPVENLIHKDHRKQDLGFMAYSLTKPPIELTIDFVCNVDLKLVKIWTQLGSLKSTGFDLFAKNKNDEFLKVASGDCEDNHQKIVFTCPDKQEISNDSKTQNFFIKSLYFLKNTPSLKILIRKTHRWCIPVVKKLEIWGFPARSLNEEDKNRIIHLWTHVEIEEPKVFKEIQERPSPEDSLFEMPEEFLDEITYEIMAIPMTLPSGKTVDQTTLEKHYKVEESWGRMPSDPFTGQTFNDKRKPILNASLKSRIDEYLLKNCHRMDIRSIPRTVSSVLRPSIKRSKSESIKLNDPKRLKIDPEDKTKNKKIGSLDDAVTKALQNAIRYSKVSSCLTIPESCFKCQENENLYKINICQHFICRNCSLTSTSSGIKICICGKRFNQSNIEKYHNKITDYR